MTVMCATPATRAGMTVINTVLGSGAVPPGMYAPTRWMGRTSWPSVPSVVVIDPTDGRLAAMKGLDAAGSQPQCVDHVGGDLVVGGGDLFG